MKKYIIYTAILAIGLLMGWFISKNTLKKEHAHNEQTINEHWTCSMHPKIDLPEFGPCPICGMDLILKTNLGEGLSKNQFKMTENAMALANIETVTISSATDSSNELVLSGRVSINDKTNAVQTAHFGGRIEKLYYKTVGEYVANGSLIATIYSPELVTAQNELIEALTIKESQPELYKAVRNKLKYWKISEKQIKTIEQTKKVQTNFNMHANVSGYITKTFVEEGNHLNEGTRFFNVTNLGSVWADFDVYEKDIKKLKIGQPIVISLNAYPNKTIKTKINYIDPLLNNITRTVLVRATLNNSDNSLKPGMLITSKVVLSNKVTNNHYVLVPKPAVLWTGKRSVVYIKTSKEAPVFELREISLGNDLGDNYEVLQGLENDDEVVFSGTFTVDAAAQLQGKKSMMNRFSENHNTEIEALHKKDTMLIDKTKISIKFKKQLGNVVSDYMALKNALVTSDAINAQKQAGKVATSLTKVDMLLLKGTAHNRWMQLVNPINESVKLIANSNNIAVQRDAFLSLGENLSEIIKTFGIKAENEKVIYLDFCPMANNNKGGFWLSYDKKIKNPYYGKKMLSCGEIIETY